MKELNAFEMEAVGGAGWLQDNFANMGAKIGSSIWKTSSELLSVDLPLIGTVNLATIAPSMGENIGQNLGSTIGGAIESALCNVPYIGRAFTALFNR